jgi:hypothetical protein
MRWAFLTLFLSGCAAMPTTHRANLYVGPCRSPGPAYALVHEEPYACAWRSPYQCIVYVPREAKFSALGRAFRRCIA